MRRGVIAAVICLLLAGFNWSITQKEALLAHGREVLVPLSPVDPRALLMGDYMALDFGLNTEVTRALEEIYGRSNPFARTMRGERQAPEELSSSWPSTGLAVIRLTDRPEHTQPRRGTAVTLPAGTAVFVRLDDGTALGSGEHYLLYRVYGQRAQVAASAFYFQEGRASAYEQARFGLLRLGGDGSHLLVNLADREGKPIEPSNKARGVSP